MALDLEGYYETELQEREALRDAIDEGIRQLTALFEKVEFEGKANGWAWRYWVSEEDPPTDKPKLSQSTTSMIAAAIERAYGKPRPRAAHGYRWHRSSALPELSNGVLRTRLDAASRLLMKSWKTHDQGSNSSTYGIDDILTLSWYVDLFQNDPDAVSIVADITTKIIERCSSIVTSESIADPSQALNAGFKSGDRLSGFTLYILLRFVRCERVLAATGNHDDKLARDRLRKKAYDRFQSGLRDQLSYGDVSDSRFDPCELAFCLEGMLHIRPEMVDDALAHRVFDVMAAFQERSPGWRPQTPLTTSHRGEVLYAIGIETATSILCSLSILDERAPRRRSAAMGHKHFPLVLKYWDWLKARRLTLSLPTGEEVTGWRSERLGGSYLHIWENSQILEFLVIFKDYLTRHVAGEMLELSELEVELPARAPAPTWSAIQADYEPGLGTKSPKFYAEIGKSFVTPRLEANGDALWSMLLYGPPGTGKTTTARNIAEALSLPLIRISVSDFLATGAPKMERRAKLIFEVLKRQMLSVVLFDELDQFLLDRDSDRFGDQESEFQMLTPGMLTKIADLRSSERVIFILATNYEDHIDSAIKRSGRVDVRYLCLPPDLKRRKKIISERLKKRNVPCPESDLDRAARVSVFLSYTDLVRICKQAPDANSLIAIADKEPRDIQFKAFGERAKLVLAEGKVPDELVGLTRMAIEALVDGEDAPRFVARMAKLLLDIPEKGKLVREAGNFSAPRFSALLRANDF